MSTLSALKSRIADDLNRSDLTSQIADAITDAIFFYKNERFYFNETRASTFATVADQSTYTSSDDADIPLFSKLDAVWIEDSDSENYWLERIDTQRMEGYLDNSAATGRPTSYTYFEQSFRFHPIPDGVYTVRPVGLIEKAAPSTDAETGNVWMAEAFELLRARAKLYLAVHVVMDDGLALRMKAAENEALYDLRRRTGKRTGTGRIQPTQF